MHRLARGVTLIELMVTIAIAALLLLVAMPLTVSWVDSARVAEAKSKLAQGYGKAKALALRNPNRAVNGVAAAALVYSTSGTPQLLVCSTAATSCTSGAASVVWQVQLPDNISLSYTTGGTTVALTALEFSNNGLATPQATQWVVAKGTQSDSFTLR